MNESRDIWSNHVTYERIASQIRTSHVRRIYERVTAQMTESRHTFVQPAATAERRKPTAQSPSPWLAQVAAKEPRMSAKEPYVSAREPHASAKEPYVSAKEPYISAIEHQISAKEPHISAKEPCIFVKEPCIFCIFVKEPIYPQKSPLHLQKSPVALCICVLSGVRDLHSSNHVCVHAVIYRYRVATISRLLKIIGLFCRTSSLL